MRGEQLSAPPRRSEPQQANSRPARSTAQELRAPSRIPTSDIERVREGVSAGQQADRWLCVTRQVGYKTHELILWRRAPTPHSQQYDALGARRKGGAKPARSCADGRVGNPSPCHQWDFSSSSNRRMAMFDGSVPDSRILRGSAPCSIARWTRWPVAALARSPGSQTVPVTCSARSLSADVRCPSIWPCICDIARSKSPGLSNARTRTCRR